MNRRGRFVADTRAIVDPRLHADGPIVSVTSPVLEMPLAGRLRLLELVVGSPRRGGPVPAGDEHGDDEALHRLLRGVWVPLHRLIDAGWAAQRGRGTTDDITATSSSVVMPEVLRQAKGKGVKVWLWAHGSSVDRRLNEAFPLFMTRGVAGVKIDYMDRDDKAPAANPVFLSV